MNDVTILKQFLQWAVSQKIVTTVDESVAVVQTAQAIARIEAKLTEQAPAPAGTPQDSATPPSTP